MNQPSSSRKWLGKCTWKHSWPKIYLDWNGDLQNPNTSDDDWEADNGSNIEIDNGVEAPSSPEHQDVSATPYAPQLILPTQWSLNQVD